MSKKSIFDEAKKAISGDKKSIHEDANDGGLFGGSGGGQSGIHLIPVTLADSGHSEIQRDQQLTLNVRHILTVQETHEREHGSSRIILTNGKSLFVEETPYEVMELANG